MLVLSQGAGMGSVWDRKEGGEGRNATQIGSQPCENLYNLYQEKNLAMINLCSHGTRKQEINTNLIPLCEHFKIRMRKVVY